MEEQKNQVTPVKLQPGEKYEVTPLGSLGLLALGDVGITLWREARRKAEEENKGSSDAKSE